MKKLLLLVLATGALHANSCVRTEGGLGYRRDHLRWSICAPGIPVYSELTYRDLDTVQGFGQAEFDYCDRYLLRFYGAGGYTWHGQDQDSDYHAAGREEEWSRSYSPVTGYTTDASFDVGIRRRNGCWEIIPRFGIEWHRLFCRSHDGVSVLGPDDETDEIVVEYRQFFLGVHATYTANWITFFNALEIRRNGRRHTLSAEAAIHYGLYHGRGDWKLRTDIDVFDHYAPAYGLSIGGKLRTHLKNNLYAVVGAGFSYNITDRGYIYWRFPNGTRGSQRLRRVQWVHSDLSIGLEWLFGRARKVRLG